MPRVRRRARNSGAREMLRLAHHDSRRDALDPGLREVYRNVPRLPIRLIGNAMGKAVNHGGILRIAESFRCEHVTFEKEPDDLRDFSGRMGAHVWQPYSWCDPNEAIAQAREDGYRIYGLTLTESAVSIDRVNWQFPAAIVLGEELAGIPPELEPLIDEAIAIPMFGLVGSLNVAAATAIVVSTAALQCHRQHPEFAPVRNLSRRLLGLEPADYESRDSESLDSTPSEP